MTVYLVAGEGLTLRQGGRISHAVTDVFRRYAVAAVVIPNGHPPTAEPANRQALQKRRAFPRRASPFSNPRLGVSVQPFSVALVFLPGDVTRVGITNQRMPLAARKFFENDTAFPPLLVLVRPYVYAPV